MDFEEYAETFKHRDAERLLPQDGRDLLRSWEFSEKMRSLIA